MSARTRIEQGAFVIEQAIPSHDQRVSALNRVWAESAIARHVEHLQTGDEGPKNCRKQGPRVHAGNTLGRLLGCRGTRLRSVAMTCAPEGVLPSKVSGPARLRREMHRRFSERPEQMQEAETQARSGASGVGMGDALHREDQSEARTWHPQHLSGAHCNCNFCKY